ncbi:MAG TPA: potassium-transporting ATPase subunit KdpC [Rudaea sp.]|jgi:K+-transporting ATPase ATPase C chain|nr:potassium-transporting ATPase subunit KdpC [Rudaea sp.]
MSKVVRQSILMLAAMTMLCGVVYPLLVTGAAQLLFRDAANGSIIERGGKTLGSELIGQPFADPKYFWSRPSATAPFANNAAASSGSNIGPTNPALAEAVKQRIDALRAADPDNPAPVPVDLVTASGSGLDPHISPAAAQYQIARVAKVRGMGEAKVTEMVAQATEGRQFGVLGEPRVNVLLLNLALDGKIAL